MGNIIYAGFDTYKFGQTKGCHIVLGIDPQALGFRYKMGLEPTKTDQSEQSYGQMKLASQIITNQNPRKLISFFAPMKGWKYQ